MLEFESLDVAMEPVKLADECYALCELTGDERDKYLTHLGGKVKMRAGKAEGMSNFGGIQSNLIARALFKCEHEEVDGEVKCVNLEEKPVSEAIVRGWPSSVQNSLFTKAQELSGLGDSSDKDGGEGND